jgi:hypothetical protein
MTSGGESDGSSGSDSEPSADNLEEEEMAQVVPIKKKDPPPKPKEKPPPPPPPAPIKKAPTLIVPKPKKPQSP